MDTPFTAVPDWAPAPNAGAGVALADLTGDGALDVVVLSVDAPDGTNAGRYRVGRAGDREATVTTWGPWQQVPGWRFWENAGAGVAVADVDGDGRPDLVVLAVDAPEGQNAGWYRVGRALDADGVVTGGWTDWTPVPDWFPWTNAGADVAVADVDGDGRLDLVVLMVDAPAGQNAAYYRSGPLGADGVVTAWRDWVAVPDWRFWENQGAGLAVHDVDGDGTPELVVLAVDSPAGQNGGWYSVGWRLDGRGRPADGWGPWQQVPDWRFWENAEAALAVAPLGARGMPHLLVLAADAPAGTSAGWYRVLDLMTDLDMAAETGVWRILEETTQVLAVHAVLLHTGAGDHVAFFAGSSNDPDRHAAGAYGTAIWHYPSPAFSRPDTPVDLFCCGHAMLPDGRLLAAGGTERYDPFLGLTQSVVLDPADGPPDAASPTGHAGRWTRVGDMAGGRWYPTLVPLADGRVLAVAGLDGTNVLNVVPEIYADGAGWTRLAPSPHWPMYAHLFLAADGRLFYSGGQYGDNQGERPALWSLAGNAVQQLEGLPFAGMRNQSATVLLPPAQDQRFMIMGGGAFDMHNQAGATASTAIADLRGTPPKYVAGPDLRMARMHLCATLLPDRTVLVNGGSMMEESAADAALDAERFDPVTGVWQMAGTTRVPRLYHSVALLMPDGKVVTAGSNPQRRTEELRIEVYWPPYLFLGARPSVVPDADRTGYGADLGARVPGAAGIGTACLVRPGATTHSMDVEQRLVDVPVRVDAADRVTLTMPASANLAPPGWYLLFVVTSDGLPSDAAWVHLA